MALRIVVLLIAAAALLSGSTRSAMPGHGETRVATRIVKTTVYADRAMVTREGKAPVVPGTQEVTVGPLPALLQDESVRVSATGTANAKIVEVRVRRMFLDTVSAARVKPLIQKSKALANHLRELRDRTAIITQQKEFLTKIGFASQESIGRELKTERPSPEEWRKLLVFFDAELTRLNGESRAVDDETLETQQAYQTVQKELREIGGSPERSEKQITIVFDVVRGGTLDISSTYIISQAGWTPRYDIRVGSADSVASLTYSAFVRQNTGEDWNNAKITLSTSRPSAGGAPPELLPWFIGPSDRAMGTIEGFVRDAESGEPLAGATVQVEPHARQATADINGFFSITNLSPGNQPIIASMYGYTPVRATAMVRPFTTTRTDLSLSPSTIAGGNVELDEEGFKSEAVTAVGVRPMVQKNFTNSVRVDDTGRPVVPPAALAAPPPMLFQTASVSSAATAASFDIAGESTIPGDNANHRVTIMVAPLGATFSHTAAPKLQSDVFFRASLRNTTEYPLLAGPMSAFVDNSFVSTSKLRAVMPGEAFDAFLGADNGIRVERKLLSRVADVSGLFSKSRKIRYEILITAENRKTTSQMLLLKENVPVSQDERVKVEILLPRPEEAAPDAGGIITWQLRLGAGEKKEMRVQYSIEAPADLSVGGLE